MEQIEAQTQILAWVRITSIYVAAGIERIRSFLKLNSFCCFGNEVHSGCPSNEKNRSFSYVLLLRST